MSHVTIKLLFLSQLIDLLTGNLKDAVHHSLITGFQNSTRCSEFFVKHSSHLF